jgi:hypothetical protein
VHTKLISLALAIVLAATLAPLHDVNKAAGKYLRLFGGHRAETIDPRKIDRLAGAIIEAQIFEA